MSKISFSPENLPKKHVKNTLGVVGLFISNLVTLLLSGNKCNSHNIAESHQFLNLKDKWVITVIQVTKAMFVVKTEPCFAHLSVLLPSLASYVMLGGVTAMQHLFLCHLCAVVSFSLICQV